MMMVRWLRQVMLGGAGRSGGQIRRLIDSDDQDDALQLEQLRRDIDSYLKRAGYGSHALKHAFAIQLDITAMLVETKLATRQALRQAAHVAHQVSHPTAAIEDHLARAFRALAWEQRMRFSMVAGILYATGTIILGTIFAWAVIEAHRDTPDAAALRAASGSFPAEWTLVMLQNDLPNLVNSCAKSPSIGSAPNGRRYCYVPMLLDGVTAKLPPLPAWSNDSRGGAAK